MTALLPDWRAKGFAHPPYLRHVPRAGLNVFRCWGGGSTEWGNPATGTFFTRQRPRSLIDAELRFNVATWGNRLWFVSSFMLLPGTPYWEGDVAAGDDDIFRPAGQLLVLPPVAAKARLLLHRMPLPQDGHVLPGPREDDRHATEH